MRLIPPLALLLLASCAAPVTHQASIPSSRRVVYQPPPSPVPRPYDGQPGAVVTVVYIAVDASGRVVQALPVSGIDPFLSSTIAYAKQCRFTPNFPTTPDSMIRLTITYTWGPAKTVEIAIKP